MSKLTIDIPHQLSQEEALKRIKGLLTNLKEEQKDIISGVSENWQGQKGDFSFSAKGFDLAGNIDVSPDKVAINADLPFALSFFKGMISNVIQQKAAELLK
ncbi:polyhydroxyalkanoic acid system family protein [Paraflavitalea pollutisoli]|uniref:polyhydroxyalkanoic acid system family protein n=1 Tax=Paraflavitalea pollutisoli TaxID=3034143 RepID=UPI0023EB8047|nr:polyhydroxyalkanoic acid system family protein [Paraflavitalea sp. H1-2-19X]